MTARGSSVTAAEGPGPWLEIAGPNDRWAASPPLPFRTHYFSLVEPGAEERAWKPPEAHITDTYTVVSRKRSGIAPSGGAEELREGAPPRSRERQRDYGSRKRGVKHFLS